MDVMVMDQRIASLVSALETLSTVTDADYPTVRLTILQAGGDDFINGIRIALVDADPFEIEKEVLIVVIKNVLQVSYVVRWLTSN